MYSTKNIVSGFRGYLKGKSILIIFERHVNIRYKYRSRYFSCKGYYVITVGLKKEKIANYIWEQQTDDMLADNISEKGVYKSV